MNILVYTVASFILSACGGSGGGGGDVSRVVTPGPGIVSPPAPTTETLTYYTLVENLSVTVGGVSHAVTVTGHCVEYQTNDYCWDDGYQIPTGLTSSHEQSFWGLCDNAGTVLMCSGGATTDPVTTPYLWSSMVGFMPTPLHQASDVYTSGIPTNVTCTDTGSVIDCVDFQIDTANATL